MPKNQDEKRDASPRQPRGQKRLIVLTLKKHRDGIWIVKLVERLNECAPVLSFQSQRVEVEVKTLEDWLSEGCWLVSDAPKTNVDYVSNTEIIGIVNRVSDAARPALFKACCALLAVAEETLQIPVWNGKDAYALCGNKWRHHIIFRQAQLSSPTTMVYFVGRHGDNRGKESRTIEIDTRLFRQNASGATEVLIKPNAGGFGAGIEKISIPARSAPSTSDTMQHSAQTTITITIRIPLSFEDDMALIQQYEPPRDGKLYRLWFLNGKVQCAVERTIHVAEEGNDRQCQIDDVGVSSATEFTSGCAGGSACTFPGSTQRQRQRQRQIIQTENGNQSINVRNSDATHRISSHNEDSNNGAPTASTEISQKSLASTATPSKMVPWKVPEDVRREIEDRLLPLLKDVHCGSVEFLYQSSAPSTPDTILDTLEKEEEEMTAPEVLCPRRLYFDLNLLSTLPITTNTDDTFGTAIEPVEQTAADTVCVWPIEYDPWRELAQSIWEFCAGEDGSMTSNAIFRESNRTTHIAEPFVRSGYYT